MQDFQNAKLGSAQPPAYRIGNRLVDEKIILKYMGVSKNNGTPKSSILIGFSIINHPFWGTPIFGNTHIEIEHVVTTNSGTLLRHFICK